MQFNLEPLILRACRLPVALKFSEGFLVPDRELGHLIVVHLEFGQALLAL